MTVIRVHRQEISSLLSIHLRQGMFDEVLRQTIEQVFQPMDVAVEQYLLLAKVAVKASGPPHVLKLWLWLRPQDRHMY